MVASFPKLPDTGKRMLIFLSFFHISLLVQGENFNKTFEKPARVDETPVASSFIAPPLTLYTYQTGAWDNVDTWTTDPGGTTLVGSRIPQDGDAIVVLPSRTLTLRNGNVSTSDLDITIQEGGILDDSIYTFTQTLSSLGGKGVLKLRTTNFPDAVVNTFVNTGGGTVEYYYDGADYNLPNQLVYNNLVINSPGRRAIQTGNITLNGDLIIRSGIYQINNGTPTRLSLKIYGNVLVDAGAEIAVGTGNTTSTSNPTLTGEGGTAPFLDYYINQSHSVEIYGDFTNNGTVRFTNQTYPVFNAFPNSGIASVFFRGASNNTLNCLGTTDFYNLILDKGSDQTFVLTVNSAGYEKFRLFGANNAAGFPSADAGNPNLRKALWLRTGTLKLNGSVFIPSLVEGSASGSGDFYIPGKGALIMDGPEVIVVGTIDDYRVVNLAYGVPGGTGLVNGVTSEPSVVPSNISLYGKLQVNDGKLYIGEIGRIIYYGSSTAEFLINGGSVDIKQFQSVSGGGKTAYWQSGGNMILRGRFKRTILYTSISDLIQSIGNIAQLDIVRSTVGTEPGVGTFNIDQDANVFHMEGGNIDIYDVTGTVTPRAFEINSDPVNVDVTGGNVNIYMTSGSVPASDAGYGIASKAKLYNLNISRISGTQSSTLISIPSKAGVTGVTNPPLLVLNNLILSDATGNTTAVLNSGNFDVKVGGNFLIQTNAEYSPGSNHTVLNGSETQIFTNSGTIMGGGLFKFFVDKNSGTSYLGSNITVRDSLAIFGGTLDDGGFTLNVAGNIYNAGTHRGTGGIVLNGGGTGSQILTASVYGTPTLGNLRINSTTTNAVAAQLGSDFTVNGLTITSARVFHLGAYRLSVGSGGLVCGTPGTSKMITTNGLSSDKGLELSISLSGSYTASIVAFFPIGVTGKYTPASVRIDGSPGTVTGQLRIVPVNNCHPSSDCDPTKALQYYWRTFVTSGLTGAVTSTIKYSFTYNGATVGPKALFLDAAGTWNSATGGRDGNNLNFPDPLSASGIGFLNSDFTSGNPSNFNNVETYYSVKSGNYNDASVWSITGHTSGGGAGIPGSIDRVIIGGQAGPMTAPRTSPNDSITVPAGYTINVASININASYTNDGRSPVLNIQSTTGHTIDIVRGGGKFSTSTANIPASDYGEFLTNESAVFHFYGNSYTLPASIPSYPTLLITGGNTKVINTSGIIIKKNLIIADGVNPNNALSLNTASGNLTVFGDVRFKNGGKLLIPVSLVSRTISIYGDINFQYGNTNNVNAIEAISGAGTTHKLYFYGDTIFSGASNFSFNPANNNKIDLYIKDPGNVLTTFGTGTFSLNRLYIQKNVLTDTVYFKNNFSLNNTGNNTATKSLSLTAGTLILSDPANGTASTINLNLSSGGTSYFNIPSISALILRNGSAVNITGNTAGSGIRLDGLLQSQENSQIILANGVANTGFVEYTGSGNAAINLSGSSVFTAAQIRRSLSMTTGILSYYQAGTSAATIYGSGTIGIIDPSRAKFEITGTGSTFNMSGSPTITIINDGGTTFGDLYLRPETSLISGGYIIFGSGVTGKSYRIDASVPLNNLSVANANTVQLMINPLVVNGDLLLNDAASTFTTNNLDVTINGNFTNNGIYNAGSNTTTFSGATQLISGLSITTFRNLKVNPSLKLSLGRDLNVEGNLDIISGTLETTTFNITSKGNITNNGIYTNSPLPETSRLYLHGTGIQLIAGTGKFGRIELDNSGGARLVSSISLSEDITLTTGILDINQFQLRLGQYSEVKGTGFGVTRMIKLDGVSSNLGIKKEFGSGYSGVFVFPQGVTGKYTPAYLTVNATNSGFVILKSVDARHPATHPPFNVLNYFWEGESSITGFEGNLRLEYNLTDVTGYENQYVAARLIIPPGTGWSKAATGPTTDNVDETLHYISFDFPTGTSNLGGQYTAGYDSDLPATIPVYTSNVVSGNWETPESWSPVAPAGGPNGFAVIINPGNTISTNGNKRFSYKIAINGTLNVGTTYGHNLGTVEGTGTLNLQQPNLPAGDFSSFLSCSGGTLEYGGSSSYTIVGDRIDTVRNLIFTGSGIKTLPDKDLVICNQLLVNGPTLNNHFNRKLTILGSFSLSAGTFLSGSGPGATVTFKGSSPQTISGFSGSNKLNNLEINNSTGLSLNSAIDINGNLLLSAGIITTSSANILRMTNQLGIVTPDGGNYSSYINGPMSKTQFGGSDFTFPSGKTGRYGKIKIINPQSGIWESEYYITGYADLSATGTLYRPASTEYWRITSPANGKTARIQLRWDVQSDINPLTTSFGINDICVAEYNGTNWIGKLSDTPVGTDFDGIVQTSFGIPVNNTGSPRFYTLGSVSAVKPTIILGTSPVVCSMATVAYLAYTSTAGSPDQYKIDFDATAEIAGFTDVSTWTVLPSSPINIVVPSGIAAGIYNAKIMVRTSIPVNPSVYYSFTITVIPDLIWTGTVNTDWNSPGNWSCGVLPGATAMVIIPNVPNKPVLNAGATGSVQNLTINAGSTLTISANILKIAGTITNNGLFSANNGSIVMNGALAQTIGANVFTGNTIKDLTIDNPAGVSLLGPLSITGTVVLQSGNLASGGNLTLISNATGTALIHGSGTGQITGNVTMQRYLPSGFGYKYFSSPFQNATVNEFSDDMDLASPFTPFYAYDQNRNFAGVPASGWVSYKTLSNVLLPVSGYSINFGSIALPKTIDVTGVVNNGNISVTLYNNNNPYTKGFNLIGNPYPSAIDWDASPGWTKSNIDNALYYFKASATDQYGGTYSSYINGISSDGNATGIIPSMQGFFIHVSDGAYPVTGTLTMDNRVRITNMTHSFSKSASKSVKSIVPLVRLSASFSDNPSLCDHFVYYFDEKATNNFDNQLDGLKFFNTDVKVPNFYALSNDGFRLSVNALPFPEGEISVIPLGLRTRKDGELVFALKDAEGDLPGGSVYLYDAMTETSHNLSDSDYRVHLITGDYNNRFFLNFANISTPVKNHDPVSQPFNAYYARDILHAEINCLSENKGMLRIDNLIGQTVFLTTIYENGHHEFSPGLMNGVYVVSLISGNTRISQRLIVQN